MKHKKQPVQLFEGCTGVIFKCIERIFVLLRAGSVKWLSFRIEKGELFQINNIIPFLGIAFSQDRHTAYDVSSGLFHQFFKRA